MSRSKRKNLVIATTTAESEKEWKRAANRRLRHATNQVVQRSALAEPDEIVLPVIDEVADKYDGPKDGKQRFDAINNPRLLRK